MDSVLLQAKYNESKRNWLQFKKIARLSEEKDNQGGREVSKSL